MPRVLVADDNSNIHRTVALALKEAGVEVVAVGNGEAAVRKIAEIKPDLVLADIFMPVRNGYEVCEFVKKDPRFSHVPVVLLIGAFDPFDEREAQRVQADAILKKPFVPPDSLLRTVADLLAQSASRSAPAPAAAAPAPTDRPSAPAPASAAPTSEYMDAAPEEIAPARARLEWNSSEQPIAFGTLLETPGAGTEVDETVITSRRDPTLGEPAFWAPKAHPQGEEGEPETDGAEAAERNSATGLGDGEQWGSGVELEELPAPAEAISEAVRPESLLDLQDSAPELPEFVSPVDTLAQTPTQASRESTLQLPELPSLELAQPETVATLPALDSFPGPPASKFDAPKPTPELAREPIATLQESSWPAPAQPSKQTIAPPEPFAKIEPQAADQEDESIEASIPGFATFAPFLASLTSAASARNADAKEPFDFGPVPKLSDELSSHSAEAASPDQIQLPAAPQLDLALIEAIAQRVIERMQPQIIELVTRELLRPAVEALVQRELEKK